MSSSEIATFNSGKCELSIGMQYPITIMSTCTQEKSFPMCITSSLFNHRCLIIYQATCRQKTMVGKDLRNINGKLKNQAYVPSMWIVLNLPPLSVCTTVMEPGLLVNHHYGNRDLRTIIIRVILYSGQLTNIYLTYNVAVITAITLIL